MRIVWKLLGILLVIRGAIGTIVLLLVALAGELDLFGVFQFIFSVILVLAGLLLIRGRRQGTVREEAA